MANLELQGQLRPEVDHVPVITITRVQAGENLPGTVKKGGYGVIGIAEGIGDGNLSFSMVVPMTGLEFDVYALKQQGMRFTLSWTEGTKRLIASQCKVTSIDRSNDPGSGNYELNVRAIYGELITL